MRIWKNIWEWLILFERIKLYFKKLSEEGFKVLRVEDIFWIYFSLRDIVVNYKINLEKYNASSIIVKIKNL